MIIDACVLIDFLGADRTILQLVRDHVGPIHVISAIIEEVDEIDAEQDLDELGLIVVEAELEDAYAAAASAPSTSFQDRLCMLTAKRHGFICVTNDRNLRALCRQQGIPTLWGLEMLAELHRMGGIPSGDAVAVAQAIREANPHHITARIIERFREKIRRQEG